MITVYGTADGHLAPLTWDEGAPRPAGAIWIDLLTPTAAEEEAVERISGIDLPTQAKLQEIEMSSRLYQEGNARYMAATVMSKADEPHAEAEAIAFVVCPPLLITLRYSDPFAFSAFATRAMRQTGLVEGGGETIFAGLLEAIVDRAADILEHVTIDLDRLSREVFRARIDKATGRVLPGMDLEEAVRRLGRSEDLTSKVQDSLSSITRLLTFFGVSMASEVKKDYKARLKVIARDAHSIQEHATSLAQKGNFLLDATLGLINIQQTKIIKIFSVASVVFLPPTLIASIYGMNFKFLPELSLSLGYPMAIAMMIASAALPYFYFKRKGWL